MGDRRSDIQILRGFAVLIVMLSHFGAIVPGGFIGVDVFFIISGFVITLSLVRLKNKSDSVSSFLAEFYKRRFFRLVPTLVVVLLCTLLAGFVLLTPGEFRIQAQMSIWSLFFAGNIGAELLDGGGYFLDSAGPNWLLHLWSLGVEEQFYFFFPLLFLVLFRIHGLWASRKGTFVIGGILALAFIPSLLNELDAATSMSGLTAKVDVWNAVFGYYSPVTRAWQFLVGVLAAQMTLRRPPHPRSSIFQFLTATGLIVSVLFFQESELHPGPFALVPSLFVFLILLAPLNDKYTSTRFFRWLNWLGDRSYSAYLWHWPVWSVTSQLQFPLPLSIPASFGVTFLLAWLSYRYIEKSEYFAVGSKGGLSKPREGLRKKSFLIGLGLALALIPSLAFGLKSLADERLQLLGFTSPAVPRYQVELDCLELNCSELGVNALLVGDSHAGALFDSLRSELLKLDVNLGAVVQVGCFHLAGNEVLESKQACIPPSKSLSKVVQEVRPSWIFVHGYSAGRLTNVNSGISESVQVTRRDGRPIDGSNYIETYGLAVGEFLNTYSVGETRIMFISSLPDFSRNLSTPFLGDKPATMWNIIFSSEDSFQRGDAVTRQQFLDRHGGFETLDKQAARNPFVYQHSSWGSLCFESYCSQITPDGAYLFADTDHLSEFGASRLAEAVAIHTRQIIETD